MQKQFSSGHQFFCVNVSGKLCLYQWWCSQFYAGSDTNRGNCWQSRWSRTNGVRYFLHKFKMKQKREETRGSCFCLGVLFQVPQTLSLDFPRRENRLVAIYGSFSQRRLSVTGETQRFCTAGPMRVSPRLRTGYRSCASIRWSWPNQDCRAATTSSPRRLDPVKLTSPSTSSTSTWRDLGMCTNVFTLFPVPILVRDPLMTWPLPALKII